MWLSFWLFISSRLSDAVLLNFWQAPCIITRGNRTEQSGKITKQAQTRFSNTEYRVWPKGNETAKQHTASTALHSSKRQNYSHETGSVKQLKQLWNVLFSFNGKEKYLCDKLQKSFLFTIWQQSSQKHLSQITQCGLPTTLQLIIVTEWASIQPTAVSFSLKANTSVSVTICCQVTRGEV